MDNFELPDLTTLPDLSDLQDLVQELASVASVEALPVDTLSVPVVTVGWVTRLVFLLARYAPLLAFLGALVENTALLGFIFPGGTAVVLAGAGARAAGLPLSLVVALAALGMTAGATVDYYLGYAGAARLLRHPRAGRLGQRLATQLDDAVPLLRHHGWWMLLIAHAFGHGRSSLAVAAGASRLPLRFFLRLEAPAALLWAALYAGGGYYLAAEWSRLELALRRAGWAGAALLLIGAGTWLVQRWWRERSRPPAAPGPAVSTVSTAAGALVPATAEASPPEDS